MVDVYVRNFAHATPELELFTKTHVSARDNNARMAGKKPETFTAKENAELRRVLKELQGREGWSQRELGEALDIGQQGAGTLLRGGGFGRFTANKLALRFGFLSGDELLRARGAMADPMTVPQGWQTREMAVGIARSMGYPEEILRRVVVKYQESQYSSLPPRWWNDRIVNEAREQDEVSRLNTPVSPASPARVKAPAKEPLPRRPRKAG